MSTTDAAHHLELVLGPDARPSPIVVPELVIAGWTGRDAAAVEKHISELEELGVRRPASIPVYYRVAARRLTTASAIEVSGEASSGEVEFVLLAHGGALWVGVGSDHTDRKVEAYNVTVSKQVCEKPVARTFWAFSEVAPHWDSLILRSFIEEDGKAVLYQEGSVAALRPADALIAAYGGANGGRDAGGLADGLALFGGTLPARGGIRPAGRFAFEIEDPVLGRRISHAYSVKTLPVVG
jgi:hypothetical protein